MSKELTAFNPAQLPAFAKTVEISELARSLSGGGSGCLLYTSDAADE